MITLTLNPKTNPTAKVFNKPLVVIGGSGHNNSKIDLTLPDEKLTAEHIKIQCLDNKYQITNLANDPFLSLNGLPFGKRILKKGDLLTVGNTEIVFDFNVHSSTQEESPSLEDSLQQFLMGKLIGKGQKSDSDLSHKGPEPVDHPIIHSRGHKGDHPQELLRSQNSNFDADRSINSFESLDSLNPLPYSLEETQIAEEQANRSMVKKMFFATLTFFVLLAIVIGSIYVVVSEQTVFYEIKAAQGISDVAMALTYAQLNHIRPLSQNWSDPDFLNDNLASVLSTEYAPLSKTNIQGEFDNSPYFLRIYTSHDASEFLVIAQPAPSILQWLIPKTVILIDSHTMEIRKTSDIRMLNRLLADPDNLDFSDSPEISNIVHQGQIVPLTSLALDQTHPEFAPPKELSFVRPEAKNLIYNAPRYHKFSSPIIQKVLHLDQNPNNIAPLLQNIAIVSKLHDMVLYSTDGPTGAQQIQRGLMPYAPSRGFLIGYLTFDPRTEKINGSHLIMMAKSFTKSIGSSAPHPVNPAPNDPGVETAPLTVENQVAMHPVESESLHPLFTAISNLATLRQEELNTLTKEMILLMENHAQKSTGSFADQFQQLSTRYIQLNEELDTRIGEELHKLFQEHRGEDASLSTALFSDYVNRAGLEVFLNDEIKAEIAHQQSPLSFDTSFNNLVEAIKSVKTMPELNRATEEAANLLTPDHFPNLANLLVSQGLLRLTVMQKLEELILFPTDEATNHHEKDRWLLLSILKNGKVNDPDEREFYITEFDKNMKSNSSISM